MKAKAISWLTDPAVLGFAALVLLIVASQIALTVGASVRYPPGPSAPGPWTVGVVYWLAGAALTVTALRRKRSAVVVGVSVLNGLFALITAVIIVANIVG